MTDTPGAPQDPQQPGGPPAGQVPPAPPPQGQPGQPQQAAGIDPKVGGAVAYLTWVGGLIMFLTQTHPEVRFHGMQSILFNVALFVLWIAYLIVAFALAVIGVPFVSGLLYLVLLLGGFAAWLVLTIKAYNLEHFKLPIVGDMAEKYSAKQA